jgi:hypothetical protein
MKRSHGLEARFANRTHVEGKHHSAANADLVQCEGEARSSPSHWTTRPSASVGGALWTAPASAQQCDAAVKAPAFASFPASLAKLLLHAPEKWCS